MNEPSDTEKVAAAILILETFADENENNPEEPEQYLWWDLLNDVLSALKPGP